MCNYAVLLRASDGLYRTYNVLSFQTTNSAIADKSARRVYRSVKVTKHGTIRSVTYSFLLVCFSNFVAKTCCFWDISIQWAWNPG